MRSNAAVKSAKRALEVVELLEKLQRSAAVAEIAALLEYPQSSTSVLLSGLRRLGYLQYDGEARTYALSLRVALIGSGLQVGGQPTSNVFELVRQVHAATLLSTAIVTRSEVYMQYVYTMRGVEMDLVGYEPGMLLPLCRTAAGLALLSSCSEVEIGKIIRRLNTEERDKPLLVLSSVMEDVQTFRRQGFICIVSRVIQSAGSVAIRLPFNDVFGLPLALCVGGSAGKLHAEAETLAKVMGDAVARLGWDTKGIPTSGVKTD